MKAAIGRLIPTDLAEKLAEYSIAQREPSVSLANSVPIVLPGTSWMDVVERGRQELWRRAIEMVGGGDLLLLEFGVWQGYSMDVFRRLSPAPGSRFFGFDSFEGLPEAWRGMKAGNFSTGGKIPDIDDPRVEFVKGWFQDTLPGQMDRLAALADGRTLIVHFDADLYSSTLFLLCTLTQRFREFHCVFDEFSGHELRALYNFIQAFGARCDFHYHVPWRGDPTTAFAKLTMPDRLAPGQAVSVR